MHNTWKTVLAHLPKIAFLIVLATLNSAVPLAGQNSEKAPDAAFIRKVYDQALQDGRCYPWLKDLCLNIGHRLSGSPSAEKAVQWSEAVLDTLGLDSVWLQPVMVPHWVRGAAEQVTVRTGKKGESLQLKALALGGSVGTGGKAISGEIVEITSWEALDALNERGIRGKIVFYNRPMDPTKIHTFEAYGGAVDQRAHGASRAAKYGAVGVLVRSMSLRLDDFPHTGSLRYDSTYTLIPAAAISTLGAEQLSGLIHSSSTPVTASIQLNCQTQPDVQSYNVIGEIRGSEFPDRVILVGGHLDSWDVGHGAHDDGAGCAQSMDVLRYLRQLNYSPRHTIRCVLFMNEENGLRGGHEYAEEAERKGEFHLCAIESDAGGFTPRGFSFDGDDAVINPFFEKVSEFQELLEPYGLELKRGGSGADIGPLKGQKGLLSGYRPDSQRYFDYHHTAADVFDAVNKRELELGAASMTALVYLLDKYGL
ncbi:MAG: M20/M25/M40 family metallo-hydrolase [Lewinellaceae bacterium]|nr:M20/M25/M40 family metallo-hydrolase [Saprospiraceae bacterium]MCB9331454.1 M20/M25/M40 family metallo-hydrolase [Lewinellaceae bacterium]